MKKDNTILLIAGLAAIGAGYYFYMKSKTPVRRGYTITVPAPEKITASQYYAQTQAPQGQSLLSSVLSIFKKPTTATTADKRTVEQMRADFYAASGGMGRIKKEIPNFY
jgi:hypothetical protein